MDEAEAQRQIKQMVNFILNEAKDKAEEIEAKALEDFNIEKLKVVQQMKEKIRQDMARKTKALATQRAIARSKAINEARLQKMIARNDYVKKVNSEVTQTIKQLLQNQQEAKRIYTDLITESALLLLEDDIEIRCRKEDFSLVESCFSGASDKYQKLIKEQARGVQKKVKFHLNKSNPMPSDSLGGIIGLCHDSLIRVENTLDARIHQEMTQNIPILRNTLFPPAR